MFKISCLVLMLLYFIWQYKVMKKYIFKFDKFDIDTENNLITINNTKIKFRDIDFATIEVLKQPSTTERTLTRSKWNYMADIIFHLKNGEIQKCSFNYKGLLYKNLKQLQNYIRIDANIEDYKIVGLPNWLVILLLVIGSIWIVATLYKGINP